MGDEGAATGHRAEGDGVRGQKSECPHRRLSIPHYKKNINLNLICKIAQDLYRPHFSHQPNRDAKFHTLGMIGWGIVRHTLGVSMSRPDKERSQPLLPPSESDVDYAGAYVPWSI